MKTIIGIDPGIKGAMAWIDRYGARVFDLPVLGNYIDGNRICRLCKHMPTKLVVWLELAQTMPGQGIASAFNYGRTYQAILTALEIAGCVIHEVRPAVWKKAMGLNAKKADARELAIKLFPHLREELKWKKDHDRAEALLIAEYGRRQP